MAICKQIGFLDYGDSRVGLTRMSRKLGIPISTVYDRLRKNLSGLLLKNIAVVDFSKVGFGCRVMIVLRLKKKNERGELREHLSCCFSVDSLFRINNGFDFLIDAVFRNVKKLEDFIDKMEESFSFSENKTYYLLEEVFTEKFLSDSLDIDMEKKGFTAAIC